MKSRQLLVVSLGLSLGACTICPLPASAAQAPAVAQSTSTMETNPFFSPSSLPFQAPPFDKIEDEHYRPALEEGMKRQIAEVEAIANSSEAPTFENTILAMERSGELLTRAGSVFFALAQSNTNDTIRAIQTEMAPKLAAHRDAIFLDPKLFVRVKAIYDKRDALGLDAEAKHLVERYYRNFVRAGAELSDADKATLRKINQEMASLSTEFRAKVLADTNESAVVVGCGGVGLNVVQGARLAGAVTIVACDLLDGKLELARAFGATHTLNASREKVVDRVRELTGGRGVDYAFDAIGGEATTLQILEAVRPGGTAVIVGMAAMAVRAPVTPYLMALQEKTLTGTMYGSVRPNLDFPRLVDLYLDGRLKIDELVSRTYRLDEINDGFAALRSGSVARGVIVFD